MATFTLMRNQARDLVVPGDRITHIDGRHLLRPMVVHEVPWEMAGALRLVNPLGTETIWNLYPETQVSHDITVERDEVAPKEDVPAPVVKPVAVAAAWDKRERAALRRNRHYVRLLQRLVDAGGTVTLPPGRYQTEATVYAALMTFYGWVEKDRTRVWSITERGRQVLAAWRTEQ